MEADIDMVFEGETYRLIVISPKGGAFLAAEGLRERISTVGSNKLRRRMLDAGLDVLIGGQRRKRGFALQERPDRYSDSEFLARMYRPPHSADPAKPKV